MKNVMLLIVVALLLTASVGCSESSDSGVTAEQLNKWGEQRDAALMEGFKPIVEAINNLSDKIDSNGQQPNNTGITTRIYREGRPVERDVYYQDSNGVYHFERQNVPAAPTVNVVPAVCPQPQPICAPVCVPRRVDNCRCGIIWGPWVDAGRGGLQVRTSHCGRTQTRRTTTAH